MNTAHHYKTYRSMSLFQRGAWLVLWGVGCLLMSCHPDTVCRQDLDVAVGVCVQWTDTNDQGEIALHTQWDSVAFVGIGTDSVPYVAARNAKCVWLPLRADTGVSSFDLLWHEKTERIDIHHTNTRQFISHACGCMVFYTIDSVCVGGTMVDSVELLNSLVGNATEEHILLQLQSL